MFGGFSDPPPPVRTPATDTPLPPADAPATDDLMLSHPPPHGPPHQPKPPSHPPPADAKRPSLLGNLRGAARKVRASHLLADEGKKRQSRARGRPPRPPPEGGINATLVLCTTLSAPYESGIEYKSLPLPEGQTLELDGRGEIVIPEGEMQVHLAHPRLGPLRSYMLAYGPLPALPPDQTSHRLASLDGGFRAFITPTEAGNYVLESIELHVPRTLLTQVGNVGGTTAPTMPVGASTPRRGGGGSGGGGGGSGGDMGGETRLSSAAAANDVSATPNAKAPPIVMGGSELPDSTRPPAPAVVRRGSVASKRLGRAGRLAGRLNVSHKAAAARPRGGMGGAGSAADGTASESVVSTSSGGHRSPPRSVDDSAAFERDETTATAIQLPPPPVASPEPPHDEADRDASDAPPAMAPAPTAAPASSTAAPAPMPAVPAPAPAAVAPTSTSSALVPAAPADDRNGDPHASLPTVPPHPLAPLGAPRQPVLPPPPPPPPPPKPRQSWVDQARTAAADTMAEQAPAPTALDALLEQEMAMAPPVEAEPDAHVENAHECTEQMVVVAASTASMVDDGAAPSATSAGSGGEGEPEAHVEDAHERAEQMVVVAAATANMVDDEAAPSATPAGSGGEGVVGETAGEGGEDEGSEEARDHLAPLEAPTAPPTAGSRPPTVSFAESEPVVARVSPASLAVPAPAVAARDPLARPPVALSTGHRALELSAPFSRRLVKRDSIEGRSSAVPPPPLAVSSVTDFTDFTTHVFHTSAGGESGGDDGAAAGDGGGVGLERTFTRLMRTLLLRADVASLAPDELKMLEEAHKRSTVAHRGAKQSGSGGSVAGTDEWAADEEGGGGGEEALMERYFERLLERYAQQNDAGLAGSGARSAREPLLTIDQRRRYGTARPARDSAIDDVGSMPMVASASASSVAPRTQPLSCSSHRGGGSGPGAVSGAAADALPSASVLAPLPPRRLPPKGVARGLPNAPTHRASYTPRGAQSLPASPRSADEPEGRLNDVLAATAALRTGAGASSRDHPLKRIVVERLLTVDSRAERAVHAAVKAPLKGERSTF